MVEFKIGGYMWLVVLLFWWVGTNALIEEELAEIKKKELTITSVVK